MLGTLKSKRGQLLQLQNKSRNWQKNKPVITKYFPFPLIPTKARTTKLAQKLEKHPKPIKTMFNQWVAERTFVLILSDYVENCLNLCPSSARRETVFSRLRAAAYDYLRLARNRLYWLPVSFWWNLFHFSIYFIEFLEYSFFLNSTDAGIILLLFWGMLRGISP